MTACGANRTFAQIQTSVTLWTAKRTFGKTTISSAATGRHLVVRICEIRLLVPEPERKTDGHQCPCLARRPVR